MKCIGIIDDEKNERDDIQVSILDNIMPDTIEFRPYETERIKKQLLFDMIRNDIINDQIQTLIIDFKLDTSEDLISGDDIIEFMNDNIPEFPYVIMTNAPEESEESKFTDVDKVYAKKIFLNPESNETKKLVNNIMTNMKKYTKKRHDLEHTLDEEISKLQIDSENQTVIENILNTEDMLSRYKPIDQSAYERKIDIKNLEEAAELLERLEKDINK